MNASIQKLVDQSKLALKEVEADAKYNWELYTLVKDLKTAIADVEREHLSVRPSNKLEV